MKKTMKRRWLAAVLALCAGGTASAYDLTVAQGEHGTVGFSVGGTAVTTAEAGEVVTVTVTPYEGYAVENVSARAYTTWAAAESRRRAPSLLKDIPLTGSGTTWTFAMPEADVEVSATYKLTRLQYDVEAEDTESARDVSGVKLTMTITDDEAGTVTVDNIVVPAALADEPLTIHVPATVAGYEVTAIAAGAIPTSSKVTDIYLPDTERPLAIEENALPATVNIHTPLALLDDYALMESLRANFEDLRISAVVTAPNRYWSFSSGVDCELPAGLNAYTVYLENGTPRIVQIPEEQLVLAGNRRGIKANNGVLMACTSGKGGDDYDIVASPGNQQSGTKPATTDAKSYVGNQLEPVIESKNFAAGSYLVLKDNQLHSIKANASKVRACRAVLRVK